MASISVKIEISSHADASSSKSLSAESKTTVLEQVETSAAQDIETADGPDSLTTIPPADGGKGAWLFLAGCFVFEALVWGFPFSFGVFQSYYTTHLPFSLSPNGIAAIGTCSSGVMYLIAPITLYYLEIYPSFRRLSSIIGLAIASTALLASSFATKVWQLILTQGVLYAIGGSLLYAPTMFYLDEWFVKRKGLAFGIMWAGVGTSGLIFPFFLSYLLSAHGHSTTLRIWASLLVALCTPLIHTIKPRLPPPSPPPLRPKISYAFLLSRTHIYLQLSNILESLGFFIPSIYLPSYCSSLSLPPYTGTLLLSLLNLFSVFGAIFLGYLCDALHITTVILISTIGSTISVVLFWGFARDLPLLILFVMGYGFFAGGFSAVWSGMMKEVRKRDKKAGMGQLMGVFAAGRGIGAVVSGPISEVLLGVWEGRVARGGYAGRYGVLIVFTGVSAFCGIVALGVERKKALVDGGDEIEAERNVEEEGRGEGGDVALNALGSRGSVCLSRSATY